MTYWGHPLDSCRDMIVLFSDGTLGHDILCVSARQEGSANDNHVELGPCDSEDSWDYDPRLAQLQHQPSGQCLKVRIMTSQSPVQVLKSQKSNPTYGV